MKILWRFFLFTVIVFFSFGVCFGQSKQDSIHSINLKTRAIDRGTKYKQLRLKDKQFIGNGPKGSELVGYFRHGRLVKSTCSILTSTTIERTEYYYSNDTLLFARVTERKLIVKENEVKRNLDKAGFIGLYYYEGNGRIFSKTVNGHGNWEKTSDIMLWHYSKAFSKTLYDTFNAN